MSFEKSLTNTESKGKNAHATYYRRIVWECIVWPLILDINRSSFTLDEFHGKCEDVSKMYDIPSSKLTYALLSLAHKGIIRKENRNQKNNSYYIHYRLIPYMRKKSLVGYGTAIREARP